MVPQRHGFWRAGKLDPNDKSVGTGVVGAPACGDVMKLQVLIKDGVITDAKFKTYGCGSAIAARCAPRYGTRSASVISSSVVVAAAA